MMHEFLTANRAELIARCRTKVAQRAPPGVLEKELEHGMFLPFTQMGADTSGLGLGLSISRRSVEANDGILSVRNVPGSGCVFTIDLPRHSLPVVSAVSTV